MSAAPMPWEEAAQQQPMPWDEAKSAGPNAGLAPAANSKVKIDFDAPTAGLPGSSPNPQPATEGMTHAAELGIGVAAAGALRPYVAPVARAGLGFVKAHPIASTMALEAAKQLPVVGKYAGKIPSWLPLMAGGKEEAAEAEYPGAPNPEIPTPVRQGAGLRTGGRVPVDPAAGLGEVPVEPVYPGASQPEHPGVFPGAPLPETPVPEVLRGNSLLRGPQRVADPAAALEYSPARSAAGSKVRSIAEPKITAAPVDPAKLGNLLNEGLEGNIPEGHTAVKSSAIRSYKYDPATREFEASTPGGTYIHGDVSPEQAKDFENASSKGKAWTELKNNSTYVGKIVNGKRVAAKPPRDLGSASPDDLTPLLQKSVDAARKARTARIAKPN